MEGFKLGSIDSNYISEGETIAGGIKFEQN